MLSSPEDIAWLRREAAHTARWLVARCRHQHHEQEDLSQDLLVDLFGRLHHFDPVRGSLKAFAGTILHHQRNRLAKRLQRENARRVPVSLDDPLPTYPFTTVGEATAEEDGYLAIVGHTADRFAAIERRHDLGRALGLLVPADRTLCADLVRRTPTDICADGRTARASLYRRIGDIRHALAAAGLRAA